MSAFVIPFANYLVMYFVFCARFREVYEQLVKDGKLVPKPDKTPPTVPMDYSWAQVTFRSISEFLLP